MWADAFKLARALKDKDFLTSCFVTLSRGTVRVADSRFAASRCVVCRAACTCFLRSQADTRKLSLL
jgi:hypothetical protein